MASTHVELPVLSATAREGGSVDYELPDLPVAPYRLLDAVIERLSDKEAAEVCAWVERTKEAREGYAEDRLRRCGAPIEDLAHHPEQLFELADFLTSWAPVVFAPWIGPGRHRSPYLGGFSLSMLPGDGDYSPEVDALHTCLSLDLLFLVVAAARNVRPDLGWGICTVRSRRAANARPTPRNVPVVVPTAPRVLPVKAVWRFLDDCLVQSRRAEVAEAHRGRLYQLYRIFAGLEEAPEAMVVISDESEDTTPESTFDALEHEAPVLLPEARRGTRARPEVVEAVSAFRSAGFFARYRNRSDAVLARMANAGWMEREAEDLPSDPLALDVALVVLDEDRTIRDDTEADVTEGADSYGALLRGLEARSSGALGLGSVQEDWRTEPEHVLVTFEANGTQVRTRLAGLSDFIDPGIVQALNEVLGERRVRFVDSGGPDMILCWASDEERARLEGARLIRLLDEPPAWWLAEL